MDDQKLRTHGTRMQFQNKDHLGFKTTLALTMDGLNSGAPNLYIMMLYRQNTTSNISLSLPLCYVSWLRLPHPHLPRLYPSFSVGVWQTWQTSRCVAGWGPFLG